MKIKIFCDKVLEAEYNKKILISDILKGNGLSPVMPCAGNHSCGKCKVRVDGSVSEVSEQEKKLLGNTDANIRLSCFTYAVGDCTIWLDSNEAAVESDGYLSHFQLSDSDGVGFAVDIGTTTIAAYAYCLETGKLIAKCGISNPQSAYGGDVISRIEAALSGNAEELSKLIISTLQNIFDNICKDNNIESNDVKAAVVTGNTTMLYLLLKYNVKCLSAAPFVIDEYFATEFTAEKLGINGYNNLFIYFPRTIDAFVGSDITCSLLACNDLMQNKKPVLMIDIGTNGEMAISNKNKLFCCSTAAGPAFEGAGISMGSIAQSGAINKVWLEENGEIKCSVIGNCTAVSVCGSGLIDAIAVFLNLGLIDESGYIEASNPKYSDLVIEKHGNSALIIPNTDISITQNDIRAVQLAKSAICAGIYSLMNACGTAENDIEALLLAGGFGSCINAENAASIGLIPKSFSNKTKSVGNAAGMGASAILLSDIAKSLSVRLANTCESLNLSTSDFFMEKYIDGMMFI